ncbi:MAG: hypothetical protein ACPGTQ_11430 [Colwellia sp.]
MAKSSPHQTHFTRQVRRLLDGIYGRGVGKQSVLEHAIAFFQESTFISSDEKEDSSQNTLLNAQRIQSHSHLHAICTEIIALTEGDNFTDTNRKTAQLLGTIQLITDTESRNIAKENEKSKGLYKAVLSLRLLDNLCSNSLLKEPYIEKCLEDVPAEKIHELSRLDDVMPHRYVSQVKVSMLMAAILQDIGLYHPKSREILDGEEGKDDPYRDLTAEERKALFHINFRETCHYIEQGIGVGHYVGNNKDERDQYNIDEKDRIAFLKRLMKLILKPEQGVGNVLKVTQIYTSIIFSTKDNYDYKLLPKVYHVLNKHAELGDCWKKAVESLYQITGMFPQGYGIVYMPSDSSGMQSDCYEYAIVNQLYPENPLHPLCRMATRKLSFIGHGQDIVVKKVDNLYFPEMAKKMTNLSKERLNEILVLLCSNSKERASMDLLPRCWHANNFFSLKTNQKLWNKFE